MVGFALKKAAGEHWITIHPHGGGAAGSAAENVAASAKAWSRKDMMEMLGSLSKGVVKKSMEPFLVSVNKSVRTKSEWSQVKRDKKSEYGSETYADPAHNSYPLTEGGKPSRERTMAAWRYAHTERDEDEYTPAERTRLQSRIKRFAKVHFDEDLQSPDEAKKSLRIAFPIAR